MRVYHDAVGFTCLGDEADRTTNYSADSRSAGRYGVCTRKDCGFAAVDQDGLCKVCAKEKEILLSAILDGSPEADEVVRAMLTRAEPVRYTDRGYVSRKAKKTPEQLELKRAADRRLYAQKKARKAAAQ